MNLAAAHTMNPFLDHRFRARAKRCMERAEHHQRTPAIGLADHIQATGLERARRAEGRTIVFLDTAAWVTVATARIY